MDEQKNNTPLKDEALEEVQGGKFRAIPVKLDPQNMGGLMSQESVSKDAGEFTVMRPGSITKKF